MAIPDFQSIMLPLLKLMGDSQLKTNKDIAEDLAEEFKLTEADLSEMLPSGTQGTFVNRIAWAKSYLKQANLLKSPRRGEWEITPKGLGILQEKPKNINIKYLERFPEFVSFRGGKKSGKINGDGKDDKNEKTPQEQIEIGFQKINSDLADDLLEIVKGCSPRFFEKLVLDLILAMGYGGSRKEAGRMTSKGIDEGIDGVINEDKLGLDTIYIQAKRWINSVTRPEIQKFAGALQGRRARKGVFITTSIFTKEAEQFVENLESKIILINGVKLAELMIEHGVGVAVAQKYELKKIDSDYFEEN